MFALVFAIFGVSLCEDRGSNHALRCPRYYRHPAHRDPALDMWTQKWLAKMAPIIYYIMPVSHYFINYYSAMSSFHGLNHSAYYRRKPNGHITPISPLKTHKLSWKTFFVLFFVFFLVSWRYKWLGSRCHRCRKERKTWICEMPASLGWDHLILLRDSTHFRNEDLTQGPHANSHSHSIGNSVNTVNTGGDV